MTTLTLTPAEVPSLGTFAEAAVLLALLTLLIAKELFDARPATAPTDRSSRAFYVGTLPLALIFVAMIVARSTP